MTSRDPVPSPIINPATLPLTPNKGPTTPPFRRYISLKPSSPSNSSNGRSRISGSPLPESNSIQGRLKSAKTIGIITLSAYYFASPVSTKYSPGQEYNLYKL